MTEKDLIIRDAEIYANGKGISKREYLMIREAYIDGANSRNKDIENIKNCYHEIFCTLIQSINLLNSKIKLSL